MLSWGRAVSESRNLEYILSSSLQLQHDTEYNKHSGDRNMVYREWRQAFCVTIERRLHASTRAKDVNKATQEGLRGFHWNHFVRPDISDRQTSNQCVFKEHNARF